MLTGSKMADSTMTSVVVSLTSEPALPMIPPIATGPSASAMTSVSGSRSRVTWSRVSSRSPAAARRTTIRPSRTDAASNVWIGLPSSTMT